MYITDLKEELSSQLTNAKQSTLSALGLNNPSTSQNKMIDTTKQLFFLGEGYQTDGKTAERLSNALSDKRKLSTSLKDRGVYRKQIEYPATIYLQDEFQYNRFFSVVNSGEYGDLTKKEYVRRSDGSIQVKQFTLKNMIIMSSERTARRSKGVIKVIVQFIEFVVTEQNKVGEDSLSSFPDRKVRVVAKPNNPNSTDKTVTQARMNAALK